MPPNTIGSEQSHLVLSHSGCCQTALGVSQKTNGQQSSWVNEYGRRRTISADRETVTARSVTTGRAVT